MSSLSSYSVETTGTITSSWLPLTTTFTVPSVCTGIFRDVGDPGGTLLAYDPNTATLGYDSTCNPVQQTNWWQSELSTSNTVKVGIGPVTCPQSWSVVQTSIKNASSTFSMCCPSGYERSDGSNGVGIADLNLGGAANESYALGCVRGVASGFVVSYYGPSGMPTTTFTASGYVYAIPIVGMNIGTASSTSSISIPTNATSTSASSSSSSSSSGETPNQGTSNNISSGLSTGAKVGIGVGVAVGILLIIGLIAFFMLKMRKKNPTAKYSAVYQKPKEPQWERAEVDGRSQAQWQRPEMDGTSQAQWQTSEMDGNAPKHPLKSRNDGQPAELAGRY